MILLHFFSGILSVPLFKSLAFNLIQILYLVHVNFLAPLHLSRVPI